MTAHQAVRKSSPASETAATKAVVPLRDLNGIVHLLTCGSVDDGKSTLIGRLLWDASDLYEDQRENVRKSGRKAADSDLPDFSMLLDGLVAEREQGITIDIAWKYFDTETRRFVIIDSPGHEPRMPMLLSCWSMPALA
jgi:bifunctional enzyme CysN/CysC